MRISLPAATPRTVGLLAALAWVAVLAGVAHLRWENDPRAFLSLGTRFQRPAAFAGVPRVGPVGYDGQFYAVLATDPLLLRPETIASLDTAGYRAVRIGVPALAWILALGNPSAAIVLYQFLCWGLALAGIGLLARWLEEEGHSPWWALLAGAGAGFATTMFRSLVDGAAVAAILLALHLRRRGRLQGSVLALTAAALIRETSLLAACALAAAELRRRRWASAVAALAVPTMFFVLWRGYLFWRVGGGLSTGTGNFALPLAWVGDVAATLSRSPRLWIDLEFWAAVGLGLTLLGFLAGLKRWLTSDAAGLTFALFSMLALILSGLVYVEVYAYSRVLMLLPVISLPLALGDRAQWRRVLLLSSVAAWALSGALITWTKMDQAWASSEPVVRWDLPARAPSDRLQQPEDRLVYLAPVAHTPGRDGAVWQTDLELFNPNPFPLKLRLEFLGHGGSRFNPSPILVELTPREVRQLGDAVGTLFGASGGGILRVHGPERPWLVRAVTYDADSASAREILPALSRKDLLRPGEVRRIEVPLDQASPLRVNVGGANLGSGPATLEIRLGPIAGASRRLLLELPPEGFRQYTDVFESDSGVQATDAGIEVEVLTPGGEVLVVASLVGPEHGVVRHVYPR